MLQFVLICCMSARLDPSALSERQLNLYYNITQELFKIDAILGLSPLCKIEIVFFLVHLVVFFNGQFIVQIGMTILRILQIQ